MAKQIVITVSKSAQAFVSALCEAYTGKGVTKETNLTQREALDAIVDFVIDNREVTKEIPLVDDATGDYLTDGDGTILTEPIIFDLLEEKILETLEGRDVSARRESAQKALASKDDEIAELRKQMAALLAAQAPQAAAQA